MHIHSNLFFNEPLGFSSENLRTSLKPFRSSFQEITLKKNDFLVKQGEVCPYFCFIDEGVLRHTIEIDGQEKTTYLGMQNTVTVALNSFLLQQPSRKSIKALFDCRLWIMNQAVFLNFVERIPVFIRFFSILLKNNFC